MNVDKLFKGEKIICVIVMVLDILVLCAICNFFIGKSENMEKEEYFEIERQANKLITMLMLCEDGDFVEYVLGEVVANGEVDATEYSDLLGE